MRSLSKYLVLTAKLKERNISNSDLAKALGISKIRLFLKLYGFISWELSEVVYICRILADTDVRKLFCLVR